MQDKTHDEGDLQIYEIGYHILPTVAEDKVSEEVGKIHSAISDHGGNIISEASPMMRALAYDIEKKIDTKNLRFNKAYFGWIKFEIEREKISSIKSMMDESPEVLRFIIVKTVRENTLYTPKAPSYKKEQGTEEKVETKDENAEPVSEEEIDKSIDELVSNQEL